MNNLFTTLALLVIIPSTPGISFAQSPVSGSPTSQLEASQPDFKKPLWFEVVNNGVKVSAPSIVYDLKSSDGKSLKWGPLTLDEDFFSVNLSSRQKLDADNSKIAAYNQDDMVLFFDWPLELMPYGLLEVSDAKGNTLWSKNLRQEDLKIWQEKILQTKDQLRKQGKKEADIENNTLLKKRYAFFRSKSETGPDLKNDEAYRFCMKNTDGESFVRICTPLYVMKTMGTQLEMQIQKPKKGSLSAEVKFQNTPQALAGKISVDTEKPSHFLAQLKTGALVEFSVVAPVLKIYDLVQTDDKNIHQSRLVAENPPPLFIKYEALTHKDPLDPTNKLWRADFKISKDNLFLPAKPGAFFQYDIAVTNLPQEKSRPLVSEKVNSTTYSYSDDFDYLMPGKSDLDTLETINPEKGQWNRTYLMVKDNKNEYKAYLDVYRGYAGEMSLRLTGLTAGSTLAMMSEFHLGYWFNSLAGWNQYYLSRQRWGLSAKYVKLQSPIPAITDLGNSQDVEISSMVVDLKYRFTPGLWERDESWGAILSYENLTYADYKVPKLGYGFFWARSMPQVFDDLFNIIPFLRYPKWVDLDVVTYGTSLDSKYNLGSDYAVNFHGKILWTPRFYGEAGFGVKNYDILEPATENAATLNTFYGTAGLGFNF